MLLLRLATKCREGAFRVAGLGISSPSPFLLPSPLSLSLGVMTPSPPHKRTFFTGTNKKGRSNFYFLPPPTICLGLTICGEGGQRQTVTVFVRRCQSVSRVGTRNVTCFCWNEIDYLSSLLTTFLRPARPVLHGKHSMPKEGSIRK